MKAKKVIYPRVYTGELSEDGKRIVKTLPKVKTKKQAEKARQEYYLKKRKPTKTMFFNMYCDYWLERKIFKAESSKEVYEMIIKKHIKPFFGEMKLGFIKKFDVEKFQKKLIKSYSNHYTNLAINILRQLFNDACKNDIILYSPTRAIKGLSYKKKTVKIPNHNECIEIAKVLKEAKKYKFPLLFGWYAGLRRGEALGVRWEDIDLKNNIINVKQQIILEGGKVICKPPKRNEIRTIPIASPLKAELIKIPIEERKGLVYRNIRSKSPRAFDDYFKKHISPLINIKNFHDFRHIIFSKLLTIPNITIDEIKKIAGHSSINITTQIYGHKTSEEIEIIRNGLDKEFN